MPNPQVSLPILYEDNHLLVVNKPAGIATMGAESGPTVHSLAAAYLKRKYQKPGNVFVGIVSRLDSMTSGVLVLARTSKAASRLAAQFAGKRQGAIAKIYLVAVEGDIGRDHGLWEDLVLKDDAAKRMRIVDVGSRHAKSARLEFVTIDRNGNRSVLAVRLLTGRKHQIRVQSADRGHPVLGDRKYAARSRFPAGVALHSWRLQIEHPTRKVSMWFEASLPKSWNAVSGELPSMEVIRHRVNTHFGLDMDEQV